MSSGEVALAEGATAPHPGLVVLFGSGETSASGRRIFYRLFRRLPQPLRVSILETPAGFEPNSDRVAGRIGEFLEERLQEFQPQVTVVPARQRGTPYSPDDPDIVDKLIGSTAIFLGPGSPTYAVRQLQDALAWQIIQAEHRLGAALILASAATIAAGRVALPVYEIYKVGMDLHWHPGLDFFAPFGLSPVFIPHWNNNDGGEELDTSRCYMGQARFQKLLHQLPEKVTIVGIDEHTALCMDLPAGTCQVLGRSGVTIIRDGVQQVFQSGAVFDAEHLGTVAMPGLSAGIPASVWQRVTMRRARRDDAETSEPPQPVLQLVEAREQARQHQDWRLADQLRDELAALGWVVQDTPQGPRLLPAGNQPGTG